MSLHFKGQLMLGDYFAVNEAASDVSEQANEAIQWIVGHDRIRNVFTLNTEFMALFRRIRSRPSDPPRTVEEDAETECTVSLAFMHYLQGTGDFVSWRQNKEKIEAQHV
ncbi:hypothetical protein B0H14DRAFT_2579670 [Mycena olivaceomarginata]|nr:hypothetical protein B0H14DRAFT_2579670 [Mycena olivaceomarginata]